MGRLERFGNLACQFEGLLDREGTVSQPLRQRVALDEFEDEEMGAAVFFEAVDSGNVRMVKRREQLRFTLETCKPLLVPGKFIGKGLDRDLASQLLVASSPHLTHAALAELARDFVVDECFPDHRVNVIKRGRRGQSNSPISTTEVTLGCDDTLD